MSSAVIAEIDLADLAATRDFAVIFAPLLRIGDIVALDGSLGAGKTELCRFIIQALGLGDDVPSPTFNLVQIYEPPSENQLTPPVWHLDLYRLESPEEALELGIEEAFDEAASLIEWPSRLGSYLPDGFLTIRLEMTGNQAQDKGRRKMTLIGDVPWRKRLESILQNGSK